MKLRCRLAALLLPALLSAPLAAAPVSNNPLVELETSMGTIVVRLTPERAPITVRNFLDYVKAGHYNGTVFHRVIPGFMIQGGGFTPDLRQKPTWNPIPLEARGGLSNDRYTIAMARTAFPNSATSQFFINVSDNTFLNADEAADGMGYAVFGYVTKGTEVVDKIADVRTGNRQGMQDVPVETVLIKSARLLP